MAGGRPSPQHADHGEDRKPQPLFAENRPRQGGDRRRGLFFAAQPRQQAKPVEEGDSDHRQKQQHLHTQQPAVCCPNQGSGAPDQHQGVDRAGRCEQRHCGVSHLREARHHVAHDRNPSRAGRGSGACQQPRQRNQAAEPQPRGEQMHHLIDLVNEPGWPASLRRMPNPAQAHQQQQREGKDRRQAPTHPQYQANADQQDGKPEAPAPHSAETGAQQHFAERIGIKHRYGRACHVGGGRKQQTQP